MKRGARSQIAQETLAVLRHGAYVAPSGSRIDIARSLQESVRDTRLIRPHDWQAIIDRASNSRRSSGAPSIEVTSETTLAAIHRLVLEEGKDPVAALNFASAKNPGGGFLGGSQAQEESLARSSGLFATLEAAPEYYQANRKSGSAIYTDHAILSPHVPIFRDDESALLEQPHQATFITMPAVNAGALGQGSAHAARVAEIMEHRIHCVLALAADTGYQAIVLGAWGCGVFRNDPEMIASLFARALNSEASWRSCFQRIVFAVYGPKSDSSNREPFEQHFGRSI